MLDTHVLLWYEVGESKLGQRALRMIERGFSSGGVCVSAISFWEVGMQHASTDSPSMLTSTPGAAVCWGVWPGGDPHRGEDRRPRLPPYRYAL